MRRPLTGARIETPLLVVSQQYCQVAPSRGRGSKQAPPRYLQSAQCRPLTGARIETCRGTNRALAVLVAPSRGRGSKRGHAGVARAVPGRPLTGARIETGYRRSGSWRRRVAPSRGRGSKPGRGRRGERGGDGRPLTGARIETSGSPFRRCRARGRPLTGARIETCRRLGPASAGRVAPSRGRGSKREVIGELIEPWVSPPHGGADRNRPSQASSEKSAKSLKNWRRLGDSNTRPTHYECAALPAELRRPPVGRAV